MAAGARIRDLVFVSHCRADESERVATNIDIRDCLLDPGHMTSNALISCAPIFVMGMLFDCACVRAVRRTRPMAFKADDIRRFDEQCVIPRTVNVMATEALHTTLIHNALHEIVSLHAVFVSRAVGEMRESGLA